MEKKRKEKSPKRGGGGIKFIKAQIYLISNTEGEKEEGVRQTDRRGGGFSFFYHLIFILHLGLPFGILPWPD